MVYTPEDTRRLTLSRFDSWHRFFNSPSASFNAVNAQYIQQSIDKVFPIFEQSDFILETFFSQHASFQSLLTMFANIDCSIEDIESFARIALETSAFIPDIDPEVGSSLQDVEDALTYRLAEIGPQSSYSALEHFLNDESYVVFEDTPRLAEISVLCLATIYGTPLVMEVLKKWTENMGSVSDFIAVTRNWEAVKTYPISWAVHLTRSEFTIDDRHV